jgi:hypothetical protein
LIFARHGVKPALAMKALSRTFWFVVLGVIVMVVVVGCCVFPTIPDPRITSYSIDIGYRQRAQYVEWKGDGTNFKRALAQVRGRKGGEYCICVIEKVGDKPYQYTGSKCPEDYKCTSENSPPINIRTVKVTKSKVADNRVNGQSAVNDPNAAYRIRSADPGDIAAVLNALEH